MYLLERINGQKGEVLACSILWYLMQRSPELREALVQAINHSNARTWLTLNNRFSIETESPASAEGTIGRIDLLMEVDDAVVGIEVKLNADFQPEQPRSYLPTVQSLADGLAKARGRPIAHLLVLLVPNRKREDATQTIHRMKIDDVTCVLAWEDLIEHLRKANASDPSAQFLLSELEVFVLSQIGDLIAFRELVPGLRCRTSDAGRSRHRKLVEWLWTVFRNRDIFPTFPVTRLGFPADKSYIGYGFMSGAETWGDAATGWYGFMEPQLLPGETQKEATLVLGLTFDVKFDESKFRRIPGVPRGFQHLPHWWEIKSDESWGDRSFWEAALKPMFEAYKRIQASQLGQQGT